ncbi:alpha/beta hydrolase family protein [Methylobacterium oryzisoli]|uniref:alpha/beta hydrolase family protein n=1 Tax=Methylobacterium oryzisoli TaxID=3385502 RepID=UPI0038922A3C
MTSLVHAPRNAAGVLSEAVTMRCQDGYVLHGHLWRPDRGCGPLRGTVIVNPATGVLARYYHAYAAFLAGQGFLVLTYDYRGVGASRPTTLKGCGIRWRHWGERDLDAVIRWVHGRRAGPIMTVGHSIGGFLLGFAESAGHVDRVLTVGAQFAYRRDYAARHRLRMTAKWHLVMPLLTSIVGYFPGRRLGWLEDLPAGVAYEWSLRRARMEASYPPRDRATILARFAAVRAPILAVGTTDDEFGTPSAIRRALAYYTASPRIQVQLTPAAVGATGVGHFGLFHARRSGTFWIDTVRWLRDGTNPWPDAAIAVDRPRTGPDQRPGAL